MMSYSLRSSILIIMGILIYGNVQAQTPDCAWAVGIGGANTDYGRSIAIDGNGNSYTTGYFKGTIDFDPGTGVTNLTSGSSVHDIYILKLDSAGNFMWVKQFVSLGSITVNAIALDPSVNGAIYVTGEFSNTVDFDPGPGVFNLNQSGYHDIFITKLDTSGNFTWAVSIGGYYPEYSTSIAVNPNGSGEVYITGSFSDTVDFDPGTGVNQLTSLGSLDIFVLKLNGSGNFIWAKRFGEYSEDRGMDIAADPSGNGNVYTSGFFRGTADFDPGMGTFNLISNGFNEDIFISKLDSSGDFLWAGVLGGTSEDLSFSITVDLLSGSIYTTGTFMGSADFNPAPGSPTLTSSGARDLFISKLDSVGNFIYAKSIGGSFDDQGKCISTDTEGNVFITGYFGGTVDFDPGPGIYSLVAPAGYNGYIFILKLDSAGNFIWAKAPVATGNGASYSSAADAAGNLYLTGGYKGTTLQFDNFVISNADSTGATFDVFIAKINNSTTGIVNLENSGFMITYPNPAQHLLTIKFPMIHKTVKIEISDLSGKIIHKIISENNSVIEINTTNFSDGLYFLRVEGASFVEVKRLVVVK